MPGTELGVGDIMMTKAQSWSLKHIQSWRQTIQTITDIPFILTFHDASLFLYFYLLAEILFFYFIQSFHNCHSSEY